jgi:hypothetical protein
MKVVDTTNLNNWFRTLALVNALKTEQDCGCELSPYAKMLLEKLSGLTTEALEHAKGQQYDSN